MGALAPATPRAERYATTEFAAFRSCDSGTRWRTYPLGEIGQPATLDEALTAALTCGKALYQKDRLIIRETFDDGRVTVHVYAIKQRSRPDYVHVDHVTRAVKRLYAEHVCSFDGVEVMGVF